MKQTHPLWTINWLIIFVTLILLSFGSSILFGFAQNNGQSLGWNQIVFSAIGLTLMFTMTFVDYRSVRSVAWWLYLLSIILLALVIIWGDKSYGAQRWIDFSFIKFQPSELVKIFYLVLLARFLSERENFSLKHFIYLIFILSMPVAMIVAQPDIGTAMVYVAIFFILLIYSKIPTSYWLVLLLALAVAMPIAYTKLKPYQKERITSFLNIDASVSYNVNQSKIAIGSGGLFGRGIGQGTQSQLQFLPVAYSDFIFAGIAEATGFIGSIFLIITIVALILLCLKTALLADDKFGELFCLGMATLFSFQMFVNIGGNLGLLPVTGIPLPLVSFGGTGIISYLLGLGVVQSIYLRKKSLSFQ
ncbi:rod shape-determining protein RodA [Candidatus Berkelbacteria bacterium CG_4_9_14_3_um_filter_39_23]|uniref:Rod shape-determining protein RodA n=1 Tax=Candidatus Berkelbacteria bacterium CG_4_9_14_3_um_filter_39_23 TaxID=1974508 RepID=A0A2M8C6K0_9BACT|nr:rod shape-determining protein RodA [Candidatus Berkelbacteria bacterium]OIP05875.1 MAG: rod shape-determining protein RodA [Candidatus Berkelbacteria bacterium CG2_30_39_44]PIR27848.1 MAG: rod shape-determining protein RodA [Candidatus Berkelbacteria bacterium CG11_big_fil_rev_8_21_14_0_20_40_23]PIZ28686.1 MAG: rod shape-determining protein RodA [Candidatus Berkelbacteria bacterium CG_4_10_14_0_8_um_filter_39_42]PJB51920.1 MAG: rod shape-determining protein RodA [Candidatus Berkelbacteria ba